MAPGLHIHGWGLFTMVDLPKDTMIVEYMGETVLSAMQTSMRKVRRHLGLVAATIVDATMIGCMACFMVLLNECICQGDKCGYRDPIRRLWCLPIVTLMQGDYI